MDAVLGILLESSVRALIIAIAVSSALLALRIQSPGILHRAWSAVLLSMLLLPALALWAPRWHYDQIGNGPANFFFVDANSDGCYSLQPAVSRLQLLLSQTHFSCSGKAGGPSTGYGLRIFQANVAVFPMFPLRSSPNCPAPPGAFKCNEEEAVTDRASDL